MGMKPAGKGRPKSKRINLKDKYKIQKKVKEHNRKLRRDERRRGGAQQKLKKDPGVPRMHPFREEILREIEESKERVEQAKLERREQQRMKSQYKPKNGVSSLEELQATAQSKSQAYEAEYAARVGALDVAPGAIQDGSRKAFYREFKKVVEAADVILQVLDARDPLGSRSPMAEQAILDAGNKKLVLVLNKIDLVPREVAEAWLKHLRNEFPTIAFKASQQQQKDRLHHGGDALGHAGSGAQGTGVLMKLLSNYCRNINIKTAIRVGVVGYPNVGKSSIINSLKRSRVCGVGATPGFTRALQEIVLDKHIRLLDSPGIVFSNKSDAASLVLRNCVRTELLEDPVGTVESMLARCQPSQIMEYYSVPLYSSTLEFLQHLSRRLGKLKKGGVPDVLASARAVLQDFNQGNVSYYVEAPAEYKPERQLAAAVVSEWSEAFDIGSLMAEEEASVLPTLKPKVEYGARAFSLRQGAVVLEDTIDDDDAVGMDAEEDVPVKTVTTTKKTKKAKRTAKAASSSAAAVATKAAKAPVEQAGPVDSTEDYDFATDFTMIPTQIPEAEESDDDL